MEPGDAWAVLSMPVVGEANPMSDSSEYPVTADPAGLVRLHIAKRMPEVAAVAEKVALGVVPVPGVGFDVETLWANGVDA
jgi:hypothetical protein